MIIYFSSFFGTLCNQQIKSSIQPPLVSLRYLSRNSSFSKTFLRVVEAFFDFFSIHAFQIFQRENGSVYTFSLTYPQKEVPGRQVERSSGSIYRAKLQCPISVVIRVLVSPSSTRTTVRNLLDFSNLWGTLIATPSMSQKSSRVRMNSIRRRVFTCILLAQDRDVWIVFDRIGQFIIVRCSPLI